MEQKIIIIGDTHGKFGIIEKIFQKENASGQVVAILHAGDVGVYDENSIGVLDESTGKYTGRLLPKEIKNILKHKDPIDEFLPYIKGDKKFPVPFYNIPGNHEDFDLYSDLLTGKIKIENFIPLDSNRIYTIDFGNRKLKIAGLGKIFPRSESVRLGKQHITIDEYSNCKNALSSEPIDIFLLHEPPNLTGKREKCFSFGNLKITELIEKLCPSKVFIGHMHFEYTCLLHQSEIFGLGYGVSGRYVVIDSQLKVNYFDLDGKDITIQQVTIGGEASSLNETAKKIVKEQRQKEKKIRSEMKRSPYNMNWLKTIVPIQVKSKEDKKSYAPLFLEISRMYYSKKAEEDIIQFAKNWIMDNID